VFQCRIAEVLFHIVRSHMNEQLALVEEALRRSRSASLGGMPLDIAVARQYGDSTVTLRTQLPVRFLPGTKAHNCR